MSTSHWNRTHFALTKFIGKSLLVVAKKERLVSQADRSNVLMKLKGMSLLVVAKKEQLVSRADHSNDANSGQSYIVYDWRRGTSFWSLFCSCVDPVTLTKSGQAMVWLAP